MDTISAKESECLKGQTETETRVQKLRVGRVLKELHPGLELCFDENSMDLVFIVRNAESCVVLTPALKWSTVATRNMSDYEIKIRLVLAGEGTV